MGQEARGVGAPTHSESRSGDEWVEGSPELFQALANGELIAEAIAYKLAPKRVPRAEEIRRSFGFPGHRL
jgi:hypothetical protein